jgi:hypothetical protein
LYKGRDASFPKASLTCLTAAFRVPSKGALPPSFPSQSFHKEGHSNSRTLHLSVKVPGKMSPTPGSPLGGRYGERCPFTGPSFTFLWASPINRLSWQNKISPSSQSPQ